MFRRLEHLLVVVLVLPSLILNEARASARPSVEPTPSKARFYPLAREYRRRAQEKIEAASQTSTRLPKHQSNLSWNAPPFESPGKGRWLLGGNSTNLLMSLQP